MLCEMRWGARLMHNRHPVGAPASQLAEALQDLVRAVASGSESEMDRGAGRSKTLRDPQEGLQASLVVREVDDYRRRTAPS